MKICAMVSKDGICGLTNLNYKISCSGTTEKREMCPMWNKRVTEVIKHPFE